MDKVLSLSNLMHPQHTYLADGKSRPMHSWLTNDGLRHLFKLIRDSDGEAAYEEDHTLAPCFDVRESAHFYFLEGEFPGVKSHNDIEIEWAGDQTLHIEAIVAKLEPEVEWGVFLGDAKQHFANGEQEETHQHRSGGIAERHSLRQLVNDRHTGQLRRSFTFQHEVDSENLKVRLQNGLLKILVPKASRKQPEPRRKVNIEC